MESPEPFEIDVRPICEAGQAPLMSILNAVDQLKPGQDLVLLAPFEPVPLYGLLAQRGFIYSSRMREDNCWEINFHQDKV